MRLHGGYFKKVCVFCLLTFFLLMPRRNEAFRTNLFPHIPGSRESVGDSAETTTRLKLSLNPLLSQNHQVHTRESGNHTSGRSRYFLFFTLWKTVPICYHRSCLFRRSCECLGRERERDVRGPESCWSFIRFPFTSLLRIFTLFGSSTQFHPLEQESGHSRRLERVLGSLSPYVGTDLFLSKRIELPPFPGFEPMTPNSVKTRAPLRHPSWSLTPSVRLVYVGNPIPDPPPLKNYLYT